MFLCHFFNLFNTARINCRPKPRQWLIQFQNTRVKSQS